MSIDLTAVTETLCVAENAVRAAQIAVNEAIDGLNLVSEIVKKRKCSTDVDVSEIVDTYTLYIEQSSDDGCIFEWYRDADITPRFRDLFELIHNKTSEEMKFDDEICKMFDSLEASRIERSSVLIMPKGRIVSNMYTFIHFWYK